jgi:diketogulonate reductase-like aldo/keto reductase
MARRYGKTSVQIALNYLISRPMVTAIPKSEKTERIKEFAGTLGWRLNVRDIEELEKLHSKTQ